MSRDVTPIPNLRETLPRTVENVHATARKNIKRSYSDPPPPLYRAHAHELGCNGTLSPVGTVDVEKREKWSPKAWFPYFPALPRSYFLCWYFAIRAKSQLIVISTFRTPIGRGVP